MLELLCQLSFLWGIKQGITKKKCCERNQIPAYYLENEHDMLINPVL